MVAVLPPIAVGGTHTIAIEGMKFHPETLAVQPGDVVVWENKDVVPHTVTAAGKFDSGKVATGARWAWTAAGSGPIEYVCTYHPGMKARLVLRGTR